MRGIILSRGSDDVSQVFQDTLSLPQGKHGLLYTITLYACNSYLTL